MSLNAVEFSTSANSFISNSLVLKDCTLLVTETDLSSFTYYIDFRALICSSCLALVHAINLEKHIYKHLESYSGRPKRAKQLELLQAFKSLNIEPFEKAFVRILDFQNRVFKFLVFKELPIISLYKCLDCDFYKTSLQNIKRHIKEFTVEEHSKQSFRLCKGQALEANRYFIEVTIEEEENLEPSIAITRSRSTSIELANSVSKASSLERVPAMLYSSSSNNREVIPASLSSRVEVPRASSSSSSTLTLESINNA